MGQKSTLIATPGCRCSRDFCSTLRCQLVAPCGSTLATECLSSLVLARIAHVLLDLARQNLGDAHRVGDGVGGRFSPCGPFGIVDPLSRCLTPSRYSGRLPKCIKAHTNGKIHDGSPRLSGRRRTKPAKP